MLLEHSWNHRSVYINTSSNEHLTIPIRQHKDADTIIGTIGTPLFRPLSLPQTPIPSVRGPLSLPQITPIPVSQMSQPSNNASVAGTVLSLARWKLYDKLTEHLEVVVPKAWPQELNGSLPQAWTSHLSSNPAIYQDKLGVLTLAHATPQQRTIHSNSLGKLLWFILIALTVVVMYIITPLLATLIPILSNGWSRFLISLEILGVSEFVICRILIKTTKNK